MVLGYRNKPHLKRETTGSICEEKERARLDCLFCDPTVTIHVRNSTIVCPGAGRRVFLDATLARRGLLPPCQFVFYVFWVQQVGYWTCKIINKMGWQIMYTLPFSVFHFKCFWLQYLSIIGVNLKRKVFLSICVCRCSVSTTNCCGIKLDLLWGYMGVRQRILSDDGE